MHGRQRRHTDTNEDSLCRTEDLRRAVSLRRRMELFKAAASEALRPGMVGEGDLRSPVPCMKLVSVWAGAKVSELSEEVLAKVKSWCVDVDDSELPLEWLTRA